MADNVTVDNGTGTDYGVASDKITYSGDADQAVQLVKLVTVSGAEGSKTATDVTTGVQYVEDAAITANLGQGTLVVARRDDALSALTPAENDAVGLRVDANGALWVAVGAALPAGTNAIGKLAANSGVDIGDVDVTSIPGVGGLAGHASPTSGNPVFIAGRASNAIPTDVGADGDAAGMWTNRHGAQMVSTAPHVGLNADPFTLTAKTVQTTSTQTGSDVVTPTSGKKLVVTSMQLQVGGTTAGTVQVWFGANADTTYTRGTDLAIFDGEFKPSSTLAPGVIMNGPWIASAADHEIHLTTSAAINPLTVTVWYYEV